MPEEATEEVVETQETAAEGGGGEGGEGQQVAEEKPVEKAESPAEEEIDFDTPVEMPDFILNAGLEEPRLPPDIPRAGPPPGPPEKAPLPPGIPTEEEFVQDYHGAVTKLGEALTAPLRAEIDALKGGVGRKFVEEYREASSAAGRAVRKGFSEIMSKSRAYRTNDEVKEKANGLISSFLAGAREHHDVGALRDIAADPEAFVGRVLGQICGEMRVDIGWHTTPTESVTVRGGGVAGAGGPREVRSDNYGLTQEEMDYADANNYTYKQIADAKKRRGEPGV